MSTIALFYLLLLLPAFSGLLVFLTRSSKLMPFLVIGGYALGLFLSVFGLMTVEEPFLQRFFWLPDFMMGWYLDRLALALIALVYLVALLIQVFSFFYMKEEKGIFRYFGFLGLFTSSMIGLLGADHLLLLFIFWELVGFSSYLLIGFWFDIEQKAAAARTAFITNKIADVFLLSGILVVWLSTDNLFISELTFSGSDSLLTWASVGLLIGAMGKSAQFPFHTWLPHAMAGPTPVSALIHAATMVAAGVYLLIRVSIIFPPSILFWVAVIGAFTAGLTAYFAMAQTDIKKVLAYSTISQLGFMVLAVGIGAKELAFFHLWTHAFFKAGLFLCAGNIIHFLSHQKGVVDPQDMRNMGGLSSRLPWTFLSLTICAMALVGLPFFTGAFSKEGILVATAHWARGGGSGHYFVAIIAFGTVALTALYMMRMWLFVSRGQKAEQNNEHAEPNFHVKVPLATLAIGALWFWYDWNPFSHEFDFLKFFFSDLVFVKVEWYLPLMSFFLIVLGVGVAWYYSRRSDIGLVTGKLTVVQNNALNGLWIDRIYQLIIVKSYDQISDAVESVDRKLIDPLLHGIANTTVVLAKLIGQWDRYIIDGFVNFVARLAGFVGNITRRLQGNNVQLQFTWLLLILAAILCWILFYIQ